MTTHFTAGMGALFAQVNGPNTEPVYLGCHQLGDIEEPQGDVELIYCPDESGPNRFKVVGSVQGAAGSPTTTITTDVTDEIDHLERVKCPFPLYVNMVKAGRRDLFTNADRTFIFTGARVTSKGLSNLSARTPDDNTRSEQSYDVSGESVIRFFLVDIAGQTISEANAINDVTFCSSESCRTDEAPASAYCQTGFAACDSAAGPATANVLATTNGSSWAATSADPFAADEHIIAIECFEFGRDSIRVIAARGVTDAANPAEIAYSDDSGTTWTAVDITSANAEFVDSPHALFALDRNHIWAGTDQGTICFSGDGGLTWTELDLGTIIVGSVKGIRFVDSQVGWVVGNTNDLARTLDGGVSWESLTGPAAENANTPLCVFAFDRNRAWVGYSSGNLYYTLDGGVTWTARSFSGSGTGQVRDIKFLNEHLGYMAKNEAVPANGGSKVLYTIDGGYTWSNIDTPSNNGLNAISICDVWNMYVCGEVTDATIGLIAKGSA